jgi:hypothetical protein
VVALAVASDDDHLVAPHGIWGVETSIASCARHFTSPRQRPAVIPVRAAPGPAYNTALKRSDSSLRPGCPTEYTRGSTAYKLPLPAQYVTELFGMPSANNWARPTRPN